MNTNMMIVDLFNIVDRYGNQKWSDKSYAQKIAKAWCRCGGDWTKHKE